MRSADKGKLEEKKIKEDIVKLLSSFAEVHTLQDGYTGAYGRSVPQPSDQIIVFPIGPSIFLEIKYTEDPISWSTSSMTKSQWKCAERCFDKNLPYFVLLFNNQDYFFLPCKYFVGSFREKRKASFKYSEMEEFKYNSIKNIFLNYKESGEVPMGLLEGL